MWDKENEVEARVGVETDSFSLTPKEAEDMEELKKTFADGDISEVLDKISTKLGISKERVKNLKRTFPSQSPLTSEEQEYLNEYREIVSEGEITPRDQRFLNKLKKVNGISEERAKEIETMVIK